MTSTAPAPATADDLTSLKARALKAYATKDYSLSSDLYAQACQLQSTLNGSDNDPRNAQLLYLYGRSLYKVAQQKSDVLGAPSDKPQAATAAPKAPADASKKPAAGVFQFQGDDESWEDDEEEDADAEEQEGEEDDDLENAWEILDLARHLFEKQLPELTAESEDHKNTRIMLSDVFDLLGEVSLESENFKQAAKDLNSSLKMKLELYPAESTLIPEAHFKLALALEFSAAGEGVTEEEAKKLRDESAEHIQKAIESCHVRIKAEEAKLAALQPEEGNGKGKASTPEKESPAAIAAKKEIANVKEMVTELEQRLEDLKNPVPEQRDDENPFQGLLGEIMAGGGDPATARRKLQEALGGANDLTSMVRKKVKPAEEPAVAGPSGSKAGSDGGSSVGKGKRRAESDVEMEEGEKEASKKARVEEAEDSGL